MYDNNFQVEGTIKDRYDAIQVTDRFQKREFILSVSQPSGSNVDLIKFQCLNNDVNLLDNVRIGYRVIVRFKISGRKWDKSEDEPVYFVNLDCTSIDVLDAVNLEEHTPDPGVVYQKDADVSGLIPGSDKEDFLTHDDKYDDLPFSLFIPLFFAFLTNFLI